MKIETIRQACIKANPEIVDLNFGCRVIWHRPESETSKAEDMNASILKYHQGKGIADLMTDNPIVFENISGRVCTVFPSDLLIIGRPIRLADVLVAIKFKRNNFILIDTSGVIAKVKNDRPLEFGERTQWNLLRDDLTLQSEETIEFIYNLIK